MKTRRSVLAEMGLASAAAFAGTAGNVRFSFAQDGNASGKVFLKIFQRGGADALHLFPPIGDPLYSNRDREDAIRPGLAIDAPLDSDPNSALDLGLTYRAMNPNLAPLMDMWDADRLLVSPSTALAVGNRSHFDCQRWIGTGERDNYIDGYLNRYMQVQDGTDDPLRAIVAGKSSVSRELQGAIGVAAVGTAGEFDIQNNDFCSGSGCMDNRLTAIMNEINSHQVDLSAVEGQVRENQQLLLSTIADMQMLDDSNIDSGYSRAPLGRGLRLVAQMVKANLPLEVAAIDYTGSWDSHSNQYDPDVADPFINQDNSWNRRCYEGAVELLRFYNDMGPLMDNIVVLVCTEFGRTVKENGSRGTDHGDAAAWFAFGGPTQGGMGPDVSSFAEDQLVRGRFQPMVVDYRDMVAEIMVRHLGLAESSVSSVFRGHSFTDHGFFTRTS